MESTSPAVEAYLLGQIPYLDCLALQERLLRHIAERDDGQIAVLFCEHPSVITVGRGGRFARITSNQRLLESRQIEVHWSNRGGGCMLHSPGQLAIYPIVPLRWHGFSLGEYLHRLHEALAKTLAELGVRTVASRFDFGLIGRTGRLAELGIAVRDGVSWHGAFLNVSPSLGLFRLVDSEDGVSRSSLMAERCGPIRMPTVRATLIRHLAEALGCNRYHLYTGHPSLRRQVETSIQ